ncbi:S-adenosyl-L-methionine-dependent methyltransferase [Aureobasidium pullulans]|nr:S-adenosyl-L-methionine-dependent methyltransferase [Aureobasidium pullulans]THW90652.1 S-adenosyl-L-methionine-dependent methyltransferase [Aureobasidium pullulans]
MELPPQLNLLRPLLLLAYSASYIPITIFRLITSSPSKLFSWSSFQHAWFGNFWSWFGGVSRESAAATVSPLVRANVHGVVLDIGPGSGEWVYLYAATANKVTKVYGVEPNPEHHAALKRRVEAAGLKGIYEILPVGAQDLGTVGLEKESIDTIVTLQTLCSCPGPQDIIKSLYPYLKKGGMWVVYEHVKTKYQGNFVGYWQREFDFPLLCLPVLTCFLALVNLVWPTFFDGCDITRPTDKWLREAGDWEEISLRAGEGEGPYDTIPHSLGTLIKRR